MLNDRFGKSVHEEQYAIIGNESQVQMSDNRDCDNRRLLRNSRMAAPIKTTQPEAVEILSKLDELDLTQRELAKVIGIEENKVSKVRVGERQMKAGEVSAARKWLSEVERKGGYRETPDLPDPIPESEYVPVEVLPTYGGMGGGGTGDGDRETALIPRALVVDVLRGQPKDFLLVNVRGDSMEPDFRHGDQILIDKRDTSPAQPGPFALWDGEWGEYVVKNVERSRSGEVRIFSSNPKYSSEKEPAENTRIIGRPVWFGRRL